MNANQIKRLYGRLRAEQAQHRTMWDRIAIQASPALIGSQFETSEGTDYAQDMYDNTMAMAGTDLADAFDSLLTNEATDWAALAFQEDDLEDNKEASQWLEEATSIMNGEINSSNFSTEMNEAWLSLAFFSNACIDVDEKVGKPDEDGWKGLSFKTNHLSHTVILEDANGVVATTITELTLTAEQAVAIYSKSGEDPGEPVRKAIDNGKPDKKFKFLHAMFPRPEYEGVDDPDTVPEKMPIASVHVNKAEGRIVRESGYLEPKRAYMRYRRMHMSAYGTGPGQNAINTQEALNQAISLSFREWEKAIDPPLQVVGQSIIGDLDMRAGALTYVNQQGALSPLVDGKNPAYERYKNEEARQQIRDYYMVDKLDLPKREEVGQMTAFEIAKRLEKALQKLGPVTGRTKNEGLDPLLRRSFNMLNRADKFPPMPASVSEATLEIEYVGPLARAQRMQAVEAMDRWQQDIVEKAGSIAAINPNKAEELLDLPDWDESERIKARELGVPASALRSEDDVKERRKERLDAASEQQELANAQMGADALNKASGAGVDVSNVVPGPGASNV